MKTNPFQKMADRKVYEALKGLGKTTLRELHQATGMKSLEIMNCIYHLIAVKAVCSIPDKRSVPDANPEDMKFFINE